MPRALPRTILWVAGLAVSGLAACGETSPAPSPPLHDVIEVPPQVVERPMPDMDTTRVAFDETARLRAVGKLADAEVRLLALRGDALGLWMVNEPDHEVGRYFTGGRLYVSLLLQQRRVADASRYLDAVARAYPSVLVVPATPDDAPDYTYGLARAEVLQAERRWAEADRVYDSLARDFPQSGYGTFSYWYRMWEWEIELGKAEVLIGQGRLDEARPILRAMRHDDLEKLAARYRSASAAVSAARQP